MTLLDVLLELLKPKKKTVAPEPVLPYGISAGYRGYTGRATTLVSGKGYFERQRSTQLLTEPSRVSGYFGVGRAVAAEREELGARIAQAPPPLPTPTPYYIPMPIPAPTPTPTPTPAPTYITEAPVVTPTRPEPTPTPTPTPSISPSQAISAGVVSAGREFTREQAPIRPPPTPSEVLSAGIAKARYGK